MRSLAERLRVGAEWLLRAAVVVLLAGWLAWTLRAQSRGAVERAASDGLDDALVRWSTAVAPARVHLALAQPPAIVERDWLAAVRGAGTQVTWRGPSLLPTAVSIEPRADPVGGADVTVAAPMGSMVVLRDTLGVLDSAISAGGGLRAYVPVPRRTVDAAVGAVVARAALHDSLALKRLLVIGLAGWETKFVVAALEERGWKVDAHIALSPKGDVRQGEIVSIDTARYAAVLAIDTTAARYGDRIASFVRSGGGLVLWSPAARARSLAPIAAGRPGVLIEDEGLSPSDSAPRAVLEVVPIVDVANDAVVLERRGDEAAIAARRLGAGRVMQVGYTNSWRWRMAGGEQAPAEHRAWLAGLVARVAHAERIPLAIPPVDPAPVAALVDHLGPPAAAAPTGAATLDPSRLAWWIFAAVCAMLLVEWASRRLRGVK